jgi:hypothetical protein
MLPKFFRTYQHKQFNYIPRYYDRQKEELQERIKRIQQEGSGELTENYKPSIIRGSFRHASAYRTKANRASSLRTIVIILILLALVLFLFSI